MTKNIRRIKKPVSAWIGAIAALSLIFTLSACEGKKDVTETSKNVTVLVDFSASTKSARQHYADAWEKIMKKVQMNDHVFVWKISAHSAMEPAALLDEAFLPKEPPKNNFQKRQISRNMLSNIEQAKVKLLMVLNSETKFSGRTAIFDSLQVAERSLKNNKRECSVLVVMSDMIEDSRYNFEKENLTDARIEAILAQLKKKELIPDLTGATVYVVGASATGAMANEKFNQVKKFWIRYFKETGANLPEANYGSTLIGFHE
jgi:hypothetical protein